MIYLITNRKLVKNGDLFSVIEKAVKGGIDAIILREKDLPSKELVSVAEKIKKIIGNKKIKLIINGDIDVARRIGGGFHIGFQEFMERKYNFQGVLGVSVHSLEEAILAEKNGANYLLAGHVYETKCKKGLEPRGIKFIQAITSKVNIPVIALGGIHENNIKEVLSSGAKGVAVMSYIMGAKEPYIATKLLKNKLS